MPDDSSDKQRNLVLCSDGTGNSGGKGNGTNVWWLYRAIDRNRNQIAFYDDGVGTENNKYVRLFGGATGFGFTRNVKDLYKYLVRNYRPGDDIYLIGFSRGAYTVRALAAFILYCGIMRDGTQKSEQALEDRLDGLIDRYRRRTKDAAPINDDDPDFYKAKIKCIGVSFDLGLKKLIEKFFFAFTFKSHNLSTDVEHAFHALSLDDQRLTFHPELWNPRRGIEQVWFAGVHSNVGGGYPKQGMSYVTLDWMMDKVSAEGNDEWGLRFDSDLRNEARLLANVHDKLYDSRAGLAAYYRYRPRDVEEPNSDDPNREQTAKGPVRIHNSVFDRIFGHTLGYNPGNLPCRRNIELVATTRDRTDELRLREEHANRAKAVRQALYVTVAKWVERGKGLHMWVILLTLLVVSSLLRLGLDSLFPDFTYSNWTVFLPFAIGVTGMMFFTETIYRWVLCPIALLLLGLAQFRPGVFGTISGEPIAVWSWVSGLRGFFLPDQAADTIVTFIERYPLAAILVVIAVLAALRLKRGVDKGLATASEKFCNEVRNPPTERDAVQMQAG